MDSFVWWIVVVCEFKVTSQLIGIASAGVTTIKKLAMPSR